MKPLVELVSAWDDFTVNNPNATVEDFCHYFLNSKKEKESQSNASEDIALATALGQAGSINKTLYKMALKENFPEIELEYYFLLHAVNRTEGIRKGDVISFNLMLEPTTSIDILNRMIKAGLLQEKTDLADKRARLLSLTPASKKLLPKLDKLIEAVSGMFFNPLSVEEKSEMLLAITKLVTTNKHLLLTNRNKSYSEIKAIAQNKN